MVNGTQKAKPVISVRVNQDLHDWVRQQQETKGKSTADVVTDALIYYRLLEANGFKLPTL